MKIRFDLRWWKNFKKKVKDYTEPKIKRSRKNTKKAIESVYNTRYDPSNTFGKYLNFVIENPAKMIMALVPHLFIFIIGSTIISSISDVIAQNSTNIILWNPAPLMEVAITLTSIIGFIMSLTRKMNDGDNYGRL